MSRERPWVVVGNPENRRVAFFQQALASRGLPAARVLSYEELLSGRASIESVPANAIVRIDSPGENFAVEKLLLAAGEPPAVAQAAPTISRRKLSELTEDRGRILWPRQWYLGLASVLNQWCSALRGRDNVRWSSHPRDIVVMFDKYRCQSMYLTSGIPHPNVLWKVFSFEELHAGMAETGWERVFVKLANSSSASGVVAIHHHRGRWAATTSTELVRTGGETRLYNSLKLRRYTDLDDIRTLVDALAAHKVVVEQWLPKASIAGRVFDLRVLVIGGAPQHMVVRTSKSPLTNLHLGNRRGDLDVLLARLTPEQRDALDATCRRVAGCFPTTLHAGLDVLFTPGLRAHYVLEVNAFGDLLPGVLNEGRTTYEAEVDAFL